MTKEELDTVRPIFSMQVVEYSYGSFGVKVQLTGLTSREQAEAAMAHMERLFCGDEIKETP